MDSELVAMQRIQKILASLSPAARERVLRYVTSKIWDSELSTATAPAGATIGFPQETMRLEDAAKEIEVRDAVPLEQSATRRGDASW